MSKMLDYSIAIYHAGAAEVQLHLASGYVPDDEREAARQLVDDAFGLKWRLVNRMIAESGARS